MDLWGIVKVSQSFIIPSLTVFYSNIGQSVPVCLRHILAHFTSRSGQGNQVIYVQFGIEIETWQIIYRLARIISSFFTQFKPPGKEKQ